MLIQKQELLPEVREHMRGGEGTVQLFQTPQDRLPAGTRLSAVIELPPGASIGAHAHEKETEVFHFIAGEGEVDDDGTVRAVKPGDTLTTGGGASHGVRNTGSEPLRFFAIIVLNAD